MTKVAESGIANYFRLFISGAMPRVPQTSVFLQRGSQKWTELVYTFGLLRIDDVWILIGAGFPDDVTTIRKRFAANIHPESQLERKDEWQTLPQLAKAGIDPKDISHVALSCIGPYNTGHLRSFPNARIHIGRTSWTDFHTPSSGAPTPPRDFMLSPDVHRWLVYDEPERLNLLDDEDTVVPGLRAFRTGGHHHGSLAFIILGEKQTYCYGDAFFTYRSITENVPSGWIHSTDDFYRARQRAIQANYQIVPAFDREVFTRHSDGLIISD